MWKTRTTTVSIFQLFRRLNFWAYSRRKNLRNEHVVVVVVSDSQTLLVNISDSKPLIMWSYYLYLIYRLEHLQHRSFYKQKVVQKSYLYIICLSTDETVSAPPPWSCDNVFVRNHVSLKIHTALHSLDHITRRDYNGSEVLCCNQSWVWPTH